MLINFLYRKVREFNAPFIKRGYMQGYEQLREYQISGKNPLDFQINYVDEFTQNGSNVAAGFSNMACPESRYHMNDGKSSYSQRDSAVMTTVDVFAPADDFHSLENMQVLHDRNVKKAQDDGVTFSDQNMIWCSGFGETFAKGVTCRPSLDFEFWKYFDSIEKYRRVYQAKKLQDPKNIFTPNIFSVGHFPCYIANGEEGINISIFGLYSDYITVLTKRGVIFRSAYTPPLRIHPSRQELKS